MNPPLLAVSGDPCSYVSITRTSRKKSPDRKGDCTCSSTNGEETLKKRARAKYLSGALARRLMQVSVKPEFIEPDEPDEPDEGDTRKRKRKRKKPKTLFLRYRDTCTCSGALTSRAGRWQARYCRHRWCYVCNRIRTAGLIQSYGDLVEGSTDLHMVTLSFANVLPEALSDAIDDMVWLFDSCKRGVRYKGYALDGVRTLEVTVSRKNFTVHPHFHILIEGREIAILFHNLWLKRCRKYGRKVSRKGQDVRPADANSLTELFKYATKGLPRLKDGDLHTDYFSALDLVFQGLWGRRLVQPFGSWYNSKTGQDVDGEDAFEDLESGIPTNEPEGTVAVWIDDLQGWVIERTGEIAGEFRPSDKWKRYINSIRGYA